jgi:hypothetical protein
MIIKPLKEDFNRIKNMEWMIPLGNGSYTLQNLFFIPERRYHSLFNFASKPPLERVSILHSLDESVKIDGKFYNLYSYKVEKQTMITEGYKNIRKISIQPSSVTYSFVIDSVIIEKIISSDYVNTLSINYAVKNTHNKNVEFFVRPFFELRSSDSLEENEPELNKIGRAHV